MGFVFFASYSSNNRTRAFERFVELLTEQVFQRIEPPLEKKAEVTFFVPSTIEVGDDWRERLVDALRISKVIVCFCSPHYFASKYCGRELQLFQQRRDAWLKVPDNKDHRARVIFPILWVKPQGEMPKPIKRYQDDEGDFPRKYKDNGLMALVELNRERDNVKRVAIELAKSIAAALKETSLPDLSGPLTIEDIHSIFHQPTEPARYQQALLCLDPKGWEWQPFERGPVLSAAIQSITGASQRLWSEIAPTTDVVARLTASIQGREAVIVLTEPDMLGAPAWQPLWAFLEQKRPDNCAVLVVWRKPLGVADVQQFEQTVRQHMPTYADAPLPHNWVKIRSQEALVATLAESAEALHMRLVQSDAPVHKVKDEQCRATARENGLHVDAKPQVSGSGGGT